MKILYVTTVSMTINLFLAPHIRMLQETGNVVELACNMQEPLENHIVALGCKTYDIQFDRNPLDKKNLVAYLQLRKVIQNGGYDIVHTHTPTASTLVRIAARELRKKGMKVFYTAHGFHFYAGAPLKNWLIFYPIEKICSYWTDVLITITKEDYNRAQTKLHSKRTEYVPGVGITLDRFYTVREEYRNKLRGNLGIPDCATLLLSVGELNDNKNHKTVLEAISRLTNDDVYYVICGEGNNRSDLEQLVRDLGLSGRVWLPGVRKDIPEWMAAADIYIHPSLREGLSVATMEAMASGLPVICGDIRGSRDLIVDGFGGMLCDPKDCSHFASRIKFLIENHDTRREMGEYNRKRIQSYSIENVLDKLRTIYEVC